LIDLFAAAVPYTLRTGAVMMMMMMMMMLILECVQVSCLAHFSTDASVFLCV